jgi:hypothetical protein
MILKWNLETQGQALAEIASLVDEGKIKSITTRSLDLTVDGLRHAHERKRLFFLTTLFDVISFIHSNGGRWVDRKGRPRGSCTRCLPVINGSLVTCITVDVGHLYIMIENTINIVSPWSTNT